MDYSSLPGNSHKEKEAASKKVSPVASGKLTKPSEGKKLASALVNGTLDDVKNHTLYDVIIPGIKKLILDGISIILWGDTKRSSSAPTSGVSRTPYTSFWSTPTAGLVPKAASAPTMPRFDYSDLAFPDKEQAVAVREAMDDVVDRFNYICVGDLYELAGIDPSKIPHTAYDWGWYDVKRAEIVESGNPDLPWVLKMPKMIQVKKN